MALIAKDASDRASQLLALSARLEGLIDAETRAMRAREPAPDGEEKARLANAYRQELARIAADPTLLAGVPEPTKAALREGTKRLQAAVAAHQAALNAVKEMTEGLVQALADEVARQRRTSTTYGGTGATRAPATLGGPIALDRSA